MPSNDTVNRNGRNNRIGGRSKYGKIISFQNIEVAPYIVEQLLDVRIDQQMNEHGTFYFKALLPEEKRTVM